jgi:hypothetical protein
MLILYPHPDAGISAIQANRERAEIERGKEALDRFKQAKSDLADDPVGTVAAEKLVYDLMTQDLVNLGHDFKKWAEQLGRQ